MSGILVFGVPVLSELTIIKMQAIRPMNHDLAVSKAIVADCFPELESRLSRTEPEIRAVDGEGRRLEPSNSSPGHTMLSLKLPSYITIVDLLCCYRFASIVSPLTMSVSLTLAYFRVFTPAMTLSSNDMLTVITMHLTLHVWGSHVVGRSFSSRLERY